MTIARYTTPPQPAAYNTKIPSYFLAHIPSLPDLRAFSRRTPCYSSVQQQNQENVYHS